MTLTDTSVDTQAARVSLKDLLDDLPKFPRGTSFGKDIDVAQETLLSAEVDEQEKRQALLEWTSLSQPCLFGRLASRGSRGLAVDICWINDHDIDLGQDHVSAKIQRVRRQWKDRAENGESSGFLIMFNSARLAFARPGKDLLHACIELSNLYLVEHAPIAPDVIYTEAIPLRQPDHQLAVFKAGCNIFYTAAHRTVNHDRRIPGGLMFSMNSPGHYANSLVSRHVVDSLEDAVEFVRKTAFRSVGNGGIGHDRMPSASWHNAKGEAPAGEACPAGERSSYVPPGVDPARYSATYHTDVLVPTGVTTDDRFIDGPFVESGAEVWPHLILDYITTEVFPPDHFNFGLFHGLPIEDCGKYHNPWPARVAHNAELFEY